MDIDLLAKMVKNLILDNDRVVLPGLGCFVAEVVPSTFSDKGYTINPPYRRLYFRAKPDEGNELIEFYAKVNELPVDIAENIIRDFLTDMKEVLFIKKTVVFPGLGRLRATKENDLFFVADENLDIYPAGFGLEPISLKTSRETPELVTEAVVGLKSILDQPVRQPLQQTVGSVPMVSEEVIPEFSNESLAESVVSEPVISEVTVPEQVIHEPVIHEPVVPEPAIPEPAPETVSELQSEPVAESDESEAEHAWLLWIKDVYGMCRDVICNAWAWLMDPARRKFVMVVGGVLAAVVLFFAFFVILANAFPDWMDSLLYSQEELEILNHRYE